MVIGNEYTKNYSKHALIQSGWNDYDSNYDTDSVIPIITGGAKHF